MPTSFIDTALRPLFQAGSAPLPGLLPGSGDSGWSAGLFRDGLISSLSNVPRRKIGTSLVDSGNRTDVSPVRLLARLSASLLTWPDHLRIELLDGQTRQVIGASGAGKAVTLHLRGDLCFSKRPTATFESEPGEGGFTGCLLQCLSGDEKRKLLGLPEPEPLPDVSTLDARLKLLLGERLHILLREDVDVSQWARAENSQSLATQVAIDIGWILPALVAITGVSWSGTPAIANVQVPGLTAIGPGQGGPLAAMFLMGSLTLGMFAKIYREQHQKDQKPVDAEAALIELLFGDRLTEKQREVLLQKARPYMASLTPAQLVAHVHKLLDSSVKFETVDTALKRLPIREWARAAEHNQGSFDPGRIGQPSGPAAAFEAFVNMLWGLQPEWGKPLAERFLNAFGLSVPVRANYLERGLWRQLKSLENQLEDASDKAERLSLTRDVWEMRHDLAMNLGASGEEIVELDRRRQRIERLEEFSSMERGAYVERKDLHATESSRRVSKPDKKSVASAELLHTSALSAPMPLPGPKDRTVPVDSVHAYLREETRKIYPLSRAGALTDLGEAVPSVETASSIFPVASAGPLRLRPEAAGATTFQRAPNIALLSGRAYQVLLNQKALEEAIPGWMDAKPAEQKKVRESLAAYAKERPTLLQLETDVAALPDDMAEYLQRRIKSRFGLDIDPRTAKLHSQTWSTQEKWAMGSQPVPVYDASAPQKTDIVRSLWEAAQANFQSDEVLPEFLRGQFSAQHLSISSENADENFVGPSISDWVTFIREENLGLEAQDRLDRKLDAAKPALLRSYPAVLKASLDIAKLSDFPSSPAVLLESVLKHPDQRPKTPSGRAWQVSPLQLFESELEAFVFHTGELRGGATHLDGGVLYIPNQCVRAFSSGTELGKHVTEIIGTTSGRTLLAERVPLDLRESFIQRAEAVAKSEGMRSLQVGLGKELTGDLWDAMYSRERVFRKRNLQTRIKPTADVDLQTTITQRVALYQGVMGTIGSLSGLPLVGPALMGPNLAAFANAAMDYMQLRWQQGTEAASKLLPDLFGSVLAMVDFEPGDVPSAAGIGVTGGRAPVLPRYFKVSDSTAMTLSPVDSSGLMSMNRRRYARMDNGDLVEVDASEAGHPRLMARWQEMTVRGPELVRQADNRWTLKPGDIDSLTSVELFKRMLPEGQESWSEKQVQNLIDDIGLKQGAMRDIWNGESPSSLLIEHMGRYQHLIDLDALPDVLNNDLSPVPQGMQPVIAQALADRTGRPLEVYVEGATGAASLKARYKPRDTTVAASELPVRVLERDGVEYTPLTRSSTNQDVPNRLSLIDSVIDSVPGFGVNRSRAGAEEKAVRREQVVAEVNGRIKQGRTAFLQMGLKQARTAPTSLDASTGVAAQVLRVFPSIPADLLRQVSIELERDAGPFDSGKAGSIVADHYAKARRHDVLFRLRHGPHTKYSEPVYLNTLVTDPAWPKGLAVKVIPAVRGRDSLLAKQNGVTRVYGDTSPDSRWLQLYMREDGTYAPIASDGREQGSVPHFAGHAPDDLGSAVLQAMTAGDRSAWTSDRARSDVNNWVAARASRLEGGKFDARMGRETTVLTAAMLADITPASVSLRSEKIRQDGTYEIDGKIYLHAYGHTYRLKEDSDGIGRYRVISSGSPESLSSSSTYAGLDFAPSISRDRFGVWREDAKDRLWTFYKLGTITTGVDVAQARVVLDIAGVSAQQLKDIQLGKKDPSPELDDAIVRARMRSVIARLSRDADHFNELQDPTPVLALLTKLDGWPRDTALEVSDQDGYVTTYGQPGTTKSVRVSLDDVQSPILQSLDDLFGTAFLDSVIKESRPSSLSMLKRFGNALSRLAGSYPGLLLDAWYLKGQEPESMLVEQLMRLQPGLTRRAAEQIVFEEKITRKADLMPHGQLSDRVKDVALKASKTTRAQRLAEAVRTGRIVSTTEKAAVKDLLKRLPGSDVDLVIDTGSDAVLYPDGELRRIRGDGDRYQVLDSNGRVVSTADDFYAGLWFALSPADREKLGSNAADASALREAVWKEAERNREIFQRHGEAIDEPDNVQPTLCRVRRMLGASSNCGSNTVAAVPQMAKDAKAAVEAVHASVDRTSRRHSSVSSSNSGSSVRSQNLGNSNLASLMVAKPIKLSTRRDTVKFPKIEETNFAIQKSALVSRSSAARESPKYLIFASTYEGANLPSIDKTRKDLLE
jgi:hypothetical protein